MYFLEQLVAEWYAYQGFFVRTNIKYGKRAKGGWEGEMDVAAFDPRNRTLVHIETSGDAGSWEHRKERLRKKFQTAKRHYKSVFNFHFRLVKRIAVVGFAQPRQAVNLGNGIELISIPALMGQIAGRLRKPDVMKSVIPEGYPLLRAIQYALWYGQEYA